MKTLLSAVLSIAAVVTIFTLTPATAHAQSKINYIASTGNVTLSGSATAATLQQPSTNSLPVSFPSSTTGSAPPVGASVYCSVACVATISRNGTAATATAGGVTNVNSNEPPAVVTFWTASNTTPGQTLAVFNIGAGGLQSIDLGALKMAAGGTLVNLTISIASITGTANITFYPVEQH